MFWKRYGEKWGWSREYNTSQRNWAGKGKGAKLSTLKGLRGGAKGEFRKFRSLGERQG